MENWQIIALSLGLFSLMGFVKGLLEAKKNNSFCSAGVFNLIGAFVWADAVVFGLFFFFFSLVSIVLNDFILFLLGISLFWLVRSVGETVYWLNQQFSDLKHNPPERFLIYKFFKNDSVWIIYQIFWQCLTVVFLLSSIYLVKLWF
ncbi:hypothetical protein C4578_01960 [Candidatus Microgenomates bacterium]|jgi:hypothetical protein|nr:MAG: hypothetical protein C4578_01960 [Candidatus Microgenomates bacterium]